MTSPFRVGSLFAGIGGFDLGLERTNGFEVVWQVEWDSYCQKVLAKHWPSVPCYGDIHDVGAHNLAPVDVLVGGFPCQPVSVAGKRKGQDDDRWLWPEFGRLICELRPRYVLVENVPGLLVRGMGDVLGDLSTFGYDAEWGIVSAASVGAPHLRKRIFIIAHANGTRCKERWGSVPVSQKQSSFECPSEDVAHAPNTDDSPSGTERRGPSRQPRRGGGREDVADAISDSEGSTHGDRSRRGVGRRQEQDISEGRQIRGNATDSGGQWAVEPDVGRVVDGLPNRVDRLKGLGNAIVPQVAEYIGRRVLAHAESQERMNGK